MTQKQNTTKQNKARRHTSNQIISFPFFEKYFNSVEVQSMCSLCETEESEAL